MCRAWRDLFISRTSLWTDLDCVHTDKTLAYLERSKSSPINLSLYRDDDLSPCDPFFRIDPNAIGRLKSLSVQGTSWNLEDIVAHLSHPSPLLEAMSVDGSCESEAGERPALTPTLLNGDLSSLRKLHLEHVYTELPWRSMVNLTTFALLDAQVSIRQLLDFFESAPHLREIELQDTFTISGAQNGRLVSLVCLKRMAIHGGPISDLLDHLLIPVGARLTIEVDLPSPLDGGRPPKFLDNLRNLPHFTAVRIHSAHVHFTGPNGEVTMAPTTSPVDATCSSLRHLTHFDTSKAKRLNIDRGDFRPSGAAQRALPPMKNLRTLTLYLCKNPHILIHALNPSMSPLGVVACPRLEKVVIKHRKKFDIEAIIGMAAARASIGAKLKSVRIVSWDGTLCPRLDVLELKKHVLRVECGQEVEGIGGDGDSDDGDEEY